MKLLLLLLALAAPVALGQPAPGRLLYADDFRHGLRLWQVESESPGSVTAQHGTLDIDVPAGVTLWFRRPLRGPILIQYQATVISAGGPNDRVSDLNSFWMATDPRNPDSPLARPRSGAFAQYDNLRMYYVGLGGNGNTTTRFRRYVGQPGQRPLLPEHDLSVPEDPSVGLVANQPQTITLVAAGPLIQYWRDGRKLFELRDPAPYTRGWFALRTTKNHLQIRHLRIFALANGTEDTPHSY